MIRKFFDMVLVILSITLLYNIPVYASSGKPPSAEVGAKSATDSQGTWYYVNTTGGIRIVSYVGNATELTIPTTLSGQTVREIGNSKRDESANPNGLGEDNNMGILYGNNTVTKVTA